MAKFPRTHTANVSAAASGTYYNALNVSASGQLHRITVTSPNTVPMYLIKIRVTVDGDVFLYSPSDVYSRSFQHNNPDAFSHGPGYAIDWFLNTAFDSSLVIEVMQASGSGWALQVAIDYSVD